MAQHAGGTTAPVLIVRVMEAGVACAAGVLAERDPNGPRPIAGSVERSLGREKERAPASSGVAPYIRPQLSGVEKYVRFYRKRK
jgi:hypothetical protein